MRLLSLCAASVAALCVGGAFAQLPPVQPQPAPKGTVAQSADDAAMKDIQFTVDTTDAVVVLNGTATASDQIARAVAIARAVDGVKSVTNILAVKTS